MPFPVLLLLVVPLPPSCLKFPSLRINGKSLPSSPSSSVVAIRMQEHRSKDAKKAVVTPLMNHIATPSSLPHPGEPWLDGEVRGLGSTVLDWKLKQVEQLVEVVVAAMSFKRLASCSWQRKRNVVRLQAQLKGPLIYWGFSMILMLSSNVCPWTSYGITNLYYNTCFYCLCMWHGHGGIILKLGAQTFWNFLRFYFLMFKNNKGI